MNQLEYQTRRKRLLDRMEEGSLALVFSGYPKIKVRMRNTLSRRTAISIT